MPRACVTSLPLPPPTHPLLLRESIASDRPSSVHELSPPPDSLLMQLIPTIHPLPPSPLSPPSSPFLPLRPWVLSFGPLGLYVMSKCCEIIARKSDWQQTRNSSTDANERRGNVELGMEGVGAAHGLEWMGV